MAQVKDCPNCQGAAALITPLKEVDEENAVYGCRACGFAFTASGKAFVQDTDELRDYFQGAELADKTIKGALAGEGLSRAAQVLLQAQLVAYGLQMWNDGLKTGLLMGARAHEHTETADSHFQSSTTTGKKVDERGGVIHP